MNGRPAPGGLLAAAVRAAVPRAVATLARRTCDFADAEDAVQDALEAASVQWARDGLPDDPTAWLITVASRRFVDRVRSDAARREREVRVVTLDRLAPDGSAADAATDSATDSADARDATDEDDTLSLLVLCCHPALPRASRIALTLRAVGGLTTRQVARGLLLPEATVGQRISRAKAALRRLDVPFALPAPDGLLARMPSVLDVIGLIHTEAHSATDGEALTRPLLGRQALTLARQVVAAAPPAAPWAGEAKGLLALVLLTDARAPARVVDGVPVPLAEQDRSRWRTDLIAEGVALLTRALTRERLGPFQVRAAIAAVHDEAPTADATDRRQLLGLYELLRVVDPGPVAELGWAVALGEVRGPDAGLTELDRIAPSVPALRVEAARAHLLMRAGRHAEAIPHLQDAARLTDNPGERRWFERRASDLARRAATTD